MLFSANRKRADEAATASLQEMDFDDVRDETRKYSVCDMRRLT